jgi:glycosyltransferase involved in cell wall biosynthesis
MNSVEEMAAALTRLLTEPALAESLARAGRDRITSEFSITRHARAIEDIYEMFPKNTTALHS